MVAVVAVIVLENGGGYLVGQSAANATRETPIPVPAVPIVYSHETCACLVSYEVLEVSYEVLEVSVLKGRRPVILTSAASSPRETEPKSGTTERMGQDLATRG